jgi:hypothetical protein
MADSISPVNLPPIAPAGDAPRQDSRGGGAGRNKKNKSPGGPKDENPEENNDTADPQSKAREKNLHPPTLTSSAPSINLTASHEIDLASKGPAQPSTQSTHTLIEEIATAIAESQAALFAGRIQDLETSIVHQQELCAALKTLEDNKLAFGNGGLSDLVATARRVHQQNLLFGAVVRRMRRHLETLRNLLSGLSLTYQPKPVKVPGRES